MYFFLGKCEECASSVDVETAAENTQLPLHGWAGPSLGVHATASPPGA